MNIVAITEKLKMATPEQAIPLHNTDFETAEVRQLYRWTVAHLNPALPTEVRELMQHYT